MIWTYAFYALLIVAGIALVVAVVAIVQTIRFAIFRRKLYKRLEEFK